MQLDHASAGLFAQDRPMPQDNDVVDLGALFAQGCRKELVQSAVNGVVVMDDRLRSYLDENEISHLKPHKEIVPDGKGHTDSVTRRLCIHASLKHDFQWTEEMAKRLYEYRTRYNGSKYDFIAGSVQWQDMRVFFCQGIATRRDWAMIVLFSTLVLVLLVSMFLAVLTVSYRDVLGILGPGTNLLGQLSRVLAGFAWLELSLLVLTKLLWPNERMLEGALRGRIELWSDSDSRDRRRREYNLLKWILESEPMLSSASAERSQRRCDYTHIMGKLWDHEREVPDATVWQLCDESSGIESWIDSFKTAIMRHIAMKSDDALRQISVDIRSATQGEETIAVEIRLSEPSIRTRLGSVSECFKAVVDGKAEVTLRANRCSPTGDGILGPICRDLPPFTELQVSRFFVEFLFYHRPVTFSESLALAVFATDRYVTVRVDDGRLVTVTPDSPFQVRCEANAPSSLLSALDIVETRVIDDSSTGDVWLRPWHGRHSTCVCVLVYLITFFYVILVPVFTVAACRWNLFQSQARNIFLSSAAEMTGIVGPFTLTLDMVLSHRFKDTRVIKNCLFSSGECQKRRVLAQKIDHVLEKAEGELLLGLAQTRKGYKILKPLIPARGCSYLTTAEAHDRFVPDNRDLALRRAVCQIRGNGTDVDVFSYGRENESDCLIDNEGVLHHSTKQADRSSIEYHCGASHSFSVTRASKGIEMKQFELVRIS